MGGDVTTSSSSLLGHSGVSHFGVCVCVCVCVSRKIVITLTTQEEATFHFYPKRKRQTRDIAEINHDSIRFDSIPFSFPFH
mmetsp:Transcript_59049/g.66851  ORF Transcript_59049/g.66851 Transcript_59049/m.66851 type:complete len:81 (-) Transcript_59049:315-557(-)